MARVTKVFHGSEVSETTEHEAKVYANKNDEIYIEVNTGGEYHNSFICFDIQTAIAFRDELTKNIEIASCPF